MKYLDLGFRIGGWGGARFGCHQPGVAIGIEKVAAKEALVLKCGDNPTHGTVFPICQLDHVEKAEEMEKESFMQSGSGGQLIRKTEVRISKGAGLRAGGEDSF